MVRNQVQLQAEITDVLILGQKTQCEAHLLAEVVNTNHSQTNQSNQPHLHHSKEKVAIVPK